MKSSIYVLIGGALFALIPPDFLKGDPAKLLMPFFSLFMAGIFPAISLTIGSLKSGGFSVKRVHDLADELGRILQYLQVLFAVALIAALTVVSAEALRWGEKFYWSFYTARVFNIVLGMNLSVLLIALPRVRRAFWSLLIISRDIAVDEASSKVLEKAAKVPSILDRYPTKEKFGELFQAERMTPLE